MEQRIHCTPRINITLGVKVSSYRDLGVHISEGLAGTAHITALVKKEMWVLVTPQAAEEIQGLYRGAEI